MRAILRSSGPLMRSLHIAFVLLAVTASSALAQRAPVIVIPGRPDVPVYIQGIDAAWGIVEGEFGLDRPNMVTETVIWRPYPPTLLYPVPGYYPVDGRRPHVGRLEILPPANRKLPSPAPTYYRYWSSESAPNPATEYAPNYTPGIVVEPQIGGSGTKPERDYQNQGGQNQGHQKPR
jgi:hypothetical protein